MTNQSPQEPQNPIPERRRRAAAGLTFDEMVGIFVAFTAIGAILFWTLGGKKSEFANNSGFGFGSTERSSKESNLGSAQIDLKDPVQQAKSEATPVAKPVKKAKPARPKAQKRNKLVAPIAGGVAASSLLNAEKAEAKPKSPKPAKPKAAKPKAPVPVPKDVDGNHWAYPFVKEMSDNGLVSKLTEDENFEPDALVTRAGMASLISNAFDTEPEIRGVKKFRDISGDNVIPADVDKAIKIGFMKGYSENTFRPEQNIPRYQVLVALATGLGLEPSGDPEATLQKLKNGTDIPDWAKKQVAAAAESGLIVNRPDFNQGDLDLQPNEPATRGEVAAMIHQALVNKKKLKPLESEYILKP